MTRPFTSESKQARERGSGSCDALIIGAGPAGSAAARALSQSGLSVILADQRTFPRDKVCGDALISDALGALTTLGLYDRVRALATCSSALRVYAPSGTYATVRGDFACVPREHLDLLLCEAAREAGATFVAGMTAVSALEADGRVTGARFRGPTGDVEIRATTTVLATGANATALAAFGLDVPMQPTAVAGRAYFEAPADIAARFPTLLIAYDRDWCPGYGWIFPSPGNRFNIGVGLFGNDVGGPRLRDFWKAFQKHFAPAAAIVAASRPIGAFRGAPLRTGLASAQFGRSGLLVVGEAAAVTYSATGEGIGKAMESGLMAAALVRDAVAGRRPVETLHDELGSQFRSRFRTRYRAYAIAQSWAAHPFVLNLVAARANAGRFAREELETFISERGDPRRLFSKRGLLNALVR